MENVDIKSAIARARQFLGDLFPEYGKDILLEEVEKSNGDWLITLSFPGRDLNLFGSRIPNQRREYKTVEIDGTTGEAKSIKIRALNG